MFDWENGSLGESNDIKTGTRKTLYWTETKQSKIKTIKVDI